MHGKFYLLFFLLSSHLCCGNYSEAGEIDQSEVDANEVTEDLEEHLSNEYGNLLLRQKIDGESMNYIFYKIYKNRKDSKDREIYTLIKVDLSTKGKRNIISKRSHGNKKGQINQKNKRQSRQQQKYYRPKYKYTDSIRSTNSDYLIKKFDLHISLSDEVMRNLSSDYLNVKEKNIFDKYVTLFEGIRFILGNKAIK